MMNLGDRMKRYEEVSDGKLIRRMPVIVRLDGCHFHTVTRGLDKPFDEGMMYAMAGTMLSVCGAAQGCVLGYTQSDEITLVLCDYQTFDTDSWFQNRIQKICSVSASTASVAFMKWLDMYVSVSKERGGEVEKYAKILDNGVCFDARCFNVPKEDVCNNLIWRQQDATRNSVLGLAQSLYSHKELQGISCKALQDKMPTEKDVNWNDLETSKKRGVCAVKGDTGWVVDYDIPIFSQNRDYIEHRIVFEEA